MFNQNGITVTQVGTKVQLNIETSYFMSNGPNEPAKFNRDDLFDDIRARLGFGCDCTIIERQPTFVDDKLTYHFEIQSELATNNAQLEGFIEIILKPALNTTSDKESHEEITMRIEREFEAGLYDE